MKISVVLSLCNDYLLNIFSQTQNQLLRLQMTLAAANDSTKMKCLNAEPDVPKCEVGNWVSVISFCHRTVWSGVLCAVQLGRVSSNPSLLPYSCV
jgi:hypothetical protein